MATRPARRHAHRPNRAGAMTATAPAQSSHRRASARQLPANARRARARRSAARDPLRAPLPRHGPPVHRRAQRTRRLPTHPPARSAHRRVRRRLPAHPPRRRPRRDRPLPPRVRRDRHAGRPRPTPRLPASPEHDHLLGQRWARARILRPVRAGHGARARTGQPTPRARSRRRPRLRRRRPHPAGRRPRGITSTRRPRPSS